MGIVRVWKQVDIELKRHVTDSWDLVLRWTSSIQEPRWGELQLLQSVQTQTLCECSLNLKEEGYNKTEESDKKCIDVCFSHFLLKK